MRRSRTFLGLVPLLTVLTLLAGCGPPADDEVKVIEPSKVPYNLLDDTTAAPSGPSSDASGGPRLYWVDARDRLVPRAPASYCVNTLSGLSRNLLSQLAIGPSASDHSAGLGTALPPARWIRVVEIENRTALLSISGDETITTSRVDLAVAQAVLTLTSVTGVDRVEIESDGNPLQVPLPSGELAPGSLRRDDYSSLIEGPDDVTSGRASGREELCP